MVMGLLAMAGVLRPDDKGGPVPARRNERAVEGVQLRGRHTKIDRCIRDREDVPAGAFEERTEVSTEVVVGNGPPAGGSG